MPVRRLVGAAAALLMVIAASPAAASAPPVGSLPKGPVTTIGVARGEVFGIALPRAGGGGRVWRIARHYDGRIVTEVSETTELGYVAAVYRALRPGTATIVYALTVGASTKALQARTFRATVR